MSTGMDRLMIRAAEQQTAVADLESILGETIESASKGPHISFRMRGPRDMADKFYLFVGATWDERDGLLVILRKQDDKLCRTVHYSWLRR